MNSDENMHPPVWKQRFAIALPVAAVLAILLGAVGLSLRDGNPAMANSSSEKTRNESRQEVPADLRDLASRAADLVDRRDDLFGGSWYDADAHQIVVSATSDEGRAEAAKTFGDDSRVAVVDADYSHAELMSEARRLVAESPALTKTASTILVSNRGEIEIELSRPLTDSERAEVDHRTSKMDVAVNLQVVEGADNTPL
jgi:hypothetical protein